MNILALVASAVLLLPGTAPKDTLWRPDPWPVLKHYDQAHLLRLALPIGGIGTGTVSLGGRGELRDWEIMNVPAKNYSTVTTGNNAPFFAVYVGPGTDAAQSVAHSDGPGTDAAQSVAHPDGSVAKSSQSHTASQTRLLMGPLYDSEYLHYEGRPVNHHGLPRFSQASFDAAYPFGQVHLSDDKLPIQVTIKGFNPLIPADEEASGLPVAVLSYQVTNTGDKPLDVSVCGSLRNFIGKDGSLFRTDWKGDYIPTGASKNRNEFRDAASLRGLYLYSEGVDPKDPAWGTMALTTQESEGVTYRTRSKADDWSNAMLGFWDDFSADGQLTEMPQDAASREDDPMASLAVKKRIEPGQTQTFTFFLTWSFPNRKSWSNTVVGNYYTTMFPDAWQAVQAIVPQIDALENETLSFVNALLQSTYPEVIKEAALFNLATLRSQTVFRLPSGHLMGWEGIMDRFGSCYGSCTHVWNYDMATPYLFGALARSMREVEFDYATRPDGAMNFRVKLPLETAAEGLSTAADGQLGCLMKIYRDWQLCGDNQFLETHWETIKNVLAYAWTPGGWDGNKDGIMEGSQHNTMDVNYFGPNPQMGFWYLGALRATEEMARAMHDTPLATTCRTLFEQGSAWMDQNLFNGAYYEHKITDPDTFAFLDMNAANTTVPDYQLGPGCLVDQLVGQHMAHRYGLGYLASKDHIQTTYKNIFALNFVPDFSHRFNNMRSYVMGSEAGLLMASWPKGRLEVPFPYFGEVMTGFEYTAAAGMIEEGLEDQALTCIQAIRDRHDGAKRNPFSEPECGHHYARSMASWGTLLAWSGFHYSAVDKTMHFTSRPGTYFWSNGYAWGTCTIQSDTVSLHVLHGTLQLDQLFLEGHSNPIAKHLNIDKEHPALVEME